MHALTLRRSSPAVLGAMCLSLCAAANSAEYHSNFKYPISLSVFVSCANGGVGEVVDLSGQLHQLSVVNISDGGRIMIHNSSQPQGVSGTGRDTGDSYRGTGGTRTMEHYDTVDHFPYIFSYVNNFRIIGQGPDNNYTVHYLIHETISAAGQVSVSFNRFSVECK